LLDEHFYSKEKLYFSSCFLISIQRYLYGELLNYANGSAFRSIFEASEKDSTKAQLKNHVTVHLLISNAPTGDAREFLPPDCDGTTIKTYRSIEFAFVSI